MLTGLKLSLPAGAAGSLCGRAAVPARAGAGRRRVPSRPRSARSRRRSASASRCSRCPGKLYLAEPTQPGDVASIVATVPAKAGVPDAIGVPDRPRAHVVIMNRLLLRESDTGVDVKLEGAYRGGQMIIDGIPTMLEGVPLPISKIEITVDRQGFFLNPTGCDPRTLTGDLHFGDGGETVDLEHRARTRRGATSCRSTRRCC